MEIKLKKKTGKVSGPCSRNELWNIMVTVFPIITGTQERIQKNQAKNWDHLNNDNAEI